MLITDHGKVQYHRDFGWLVDLYNVGSAPAVSGLDLETEVLDLPDGRRSGLLPHDGQIACAQVEWAGTCHVTHWDRDQDLVDVPDAWVFRAYLEDRTITKAIHNAVFEHSHLMKAFGSDLVMTSVHDTQVAEYVLACGRSTGRRTGEYAVPKQGARPDQKLDLGSTVRRWYGVDLDKDHDLRTSFLRGPSMSDRRLAYAALDAIFARRLAEDQARELAKNPGLARVFYEIDCPYTEAVARMLLAGMPVNPDKLAELDTRWTAELIELEQVLQAVLALPDDGEEVLTPKTRKSTGRVKQLNVRSRDQMLDRLEQTLGLTLEKFDAANLKRQGDDPVIGMVLRFKTLSKLRGTYSSPLQKLVHPVTGCIHGSFRITSTTSGRPSMSAPNLLNVPARTAEGREIRNCFVAPSDHVLGIADYAGIELRLIAEYFKDSTMIRAFQENMDLHALTGAVVRYDVVSGAWPDLLAVYERLQAELADKHPDAKKARNDAKALNFLLGYGGGAAKLQAQAFLTYGIKWTLEEAQRKRELWLNLYSGVRLYHKRMGARLKHHPIVRVASAEGRVRYCAKYTEALNHRIQATSADMTKRAHTAVCRDMTVVNVIYDEIVTALHKSEADYKLALLEAAMLEAGCQYLHEVPVVVDAHLSSVWDKGE